MIDTNTYQRLMTAAVINQLVEIYSSYIFSNIVIGKFLCKYVQNTSTSRGHMGGLTHPIIFIFKHLFS